MAKKKKPATAGRTVLPELKIEIIGLPKSVRERVAATILGGIAAGKVSEPILKPGTAVRWCGGQWKVVEWQPHNGRTGSYWLKNSRGASAAAAPSEVTVIRPAKRRAKK